ncbi:hypothetical protein JCM9279_002394 [Rhodotorula babjevae]
MSATASPPPGQRGASTNPDDDLFEGGRAKYACENCRRRKLKCTRDVPSCVFCAEHHHDCVYVKIVRTPLTRKNLDAAERRIAELEDRLSRNRPVKRRSDDSGSTARQPSPPPSFLSPPLPSLHQPASMPPPMSHTPALHQASLPPPPLPASAAATMHASPSSAVSSSPGGGTFNPIAGPSSHPYPHLPPASDLVAPAAHLPSYSGSSPFANTAAASRPPLVSVPTTFSSASGSSMVSVAGPEHAAGAQVDTTTEPEEGDGMGALSVEPGGGSGAYLGSLSGAALLNFLQRCAGDVNLSAHGSAAGKAAASPTSTIASATQILPEQMALFVNSYFACYHLQYPIVHEASFRAQLADIVPRPGGSAWNLLHQTILGLGSMCVVGAEGYDGGEAIALYEKTVASIKPHLFESNSLTAVQAFTLLANYAQKLNHTASGSVYIGIALRMAINIGLHCESSARNLSLFEQEQRRRVWWTLFCFESGSSITFSHPSTLPTAGVDVLPLANVHDAYFTPAALSRPHSVDTATPYSSLLHQVYFAQFAISVVQYLTTAQQHTITPADIQRLYRDLDVFQASLSPYFFRDSAPWFDFARAKLCWRLDNLRMIILRQTFLKVSLGQGDATQEEEQIFERCVACAGEVIRSVQRFTEARPRSAMEWWYCLHFLFPAAFVPLIALRVRPSAPAAVDWIVAVQSSRGVLERVQHALLKPLASRCLAIISAVANVQSKGNTEVSSVPMDPDFASFLEKLAAPPESSEGMPSLALQAPWQAPGLMTDLDALFAWFTPPNGSPQPGL